MGAPPTPPPPPPLPWIRHRLSWPVSMPFPAAVFSWSASGTLVSEDGSIRTQNRLTYLYIFWFARFLYCLGFYFHLVAMTSKIRLLQHAPYLGRRGVEIAVVKLHLQWFPSIGFCYLQEKRIWSYCDFLRSGHWSAYNPTRERRINAFFNLVFCPKKCQFSWLFI